MILSKKLPITLSLVFVFSLVLFNCTLSQSQNQTTGEQLNILKAAKVFPNPASNRVVLDITSHIEDDFNVEIFDLSGKRWKSKRGIDLDTGVKHRMKFDLNDVPDGNYVICITNSVGQVVKSLKLLIQK